MILSDVLRSRVLDDEGRSVGIVIDARFVLDGVPHGPLADARLVGFIVSPHTGSSFLGYERHDDGRPALIARILRWHHRGSFLVHWEDIARLDDTRVILRPGYRRISPALLGAQRR